MKKLILFLVLSCMNCAYTQLNERAFHLKLQNLTRQNFSNFYKATSAEVGLNKERQLWLENRKYELFPNEIKRLRILIELSDLSSKFSDYTKLRSNYLISLYLRENQLYDVSLAFNLKAYHQKAQINDKRDVLADQAGIYFNLKKYKKAFNCYAKLLNAFDLDSNLTGCYYNNLGNCMEEMKHFKKAIYYFKRAQKELPKIKNRFGREVYYLAEANIGMCYYELGSYSKSIQYLKNSFTFLKENAHLDKSNSLFCAVLIIQNKKQLRIDFKGELEYLKSTISKIDNDLQALSLLGFIQTSIHSFISKENRDYFEVMEFKLLRKNFESQLNKQKTINKILIDDRIILLKKENRAEQNRINLEKKNLVFKYSLIIALISLLLIFIYGMFRIQKQNAEKIRNELLITEQQKVIFEKGRRIIESEMALQKEKIQTLLINFNIKSDIQEQFLKKIKLMKKRKLTSVEDVLNEIQFGIQNLTEIDKRLYFSKIEESDANKNLFYQLKSKHPNLSNNEISFCQYNFIGLSSKEIGKITGQTEGAVRAYRHKIKQKLNLDPDIDLVTYFKMLITNPPLSVESDEQEK